MKLNYDAPVTFRFKKTFFFGVSVKDGEQCWWVEGLNQWMDIFDANKSGYNYSTHCHIHSVKAFRRHIKRHGVKGHTYYLSNRYGFGVTIKR
jgi:hypothetical protein